MIKLNLETKTKEQELIKAYLEENASDILADKINNGVQVTVDGKPLISKKDLDGFFSFARDEAKKQLEKGSQCACVEDSVVYGWAVHYFEEDSIQGKLYLLDGSEYKPTPVVSKSKTVELPSPKIEEKPKSSQTSFFDLLDSSEQSEEDTEEEIIETPVDEPIAKQPTYYDRYVKVQEAYPKSLVAIRLGDFYEFLGSSADIASKVLELTLTHRDIAEISIHMCGVPYHAVDKYFTKIREQYDLIVIENKDDSNILHLSKYTTHDESVSQEVDIDTGEVVKEDTLDDIFDTMRNDKQEDPLITRLKQIFNGDLEVIL